MVKALLYKDLRSYINGFKLAKFYNMFFIIFYLILIALGNAATAIIIMDIFVISNVIMAVFNLEVDSKTESYLSILPVKHSKIVLSKFIILIGFSLLALVIHLLAYLIVKGRTEYFHLDFILNILLLHMVCTLINALYIPLRYKFGDRKVLIPFLLFGVLLIGLLAIIIFLILNLFPTLIKVDYSFFSGNLRFTGYTLLLIAVIVFVILIFIIYFCSVRIIRGKEY
ncbi:ABC-2 transporter permease [Anaerosphaera multitolerans]|uniref:ABC-2 transporter permease n=2 Tax=Anaerosphaera multitolerans TaxID=2487351 RepID=A0A437S5P5_9FIRM|nr:ABC-2 transporter permease [Anaerosphaera multitolerans]